MVDILRFVPRSEFNCTLNLNAYITFNRELMPTAVGKWDDDIWNTSFTEKRKKSKNGKRLYFRSWEDSENNSSKNLGNPLPNPFKDFAKAFVIEFAREQRVSELRRALVALQSLSSATSTLKGNSCVTKVDSEVANFAAQLISSRFGKTSQWAYGRQLERIVDRIKGAGLTEWRMPWKQPFKYLAPPRNDRVHKAPESRISERLPDVRAILDLADIYHRATEDNDKIPTTFAALAMVAPERAGEILTLPLDCETSKARNPSEPWGIRWQPLKGGQAKTNWAISGDAMREVAQDAISYLTKRGERTRIAARWYAENPNKIYLPPGFEHLRKIGAVTIWEASKILGRIGDLPKKIKRDKIFGFTDAIGQLSRTEMDGRHEIKKGEYVPHFVKLYSLAELEAYALSRLPVSFPIVDARSELFYHDALWCLPANILRPDAVTLEHLPDPISIHQINHQLGSNPGGRTVFSRHGKVDENGNTWKITSHQFRHLLNTLAQSKYLSQELIAFWSGRKRASQNAWYNHIPQEAFIEAYLKIDNAVPSLDITGPLEEKVVSTSHAHAISRKDALTYELGATHKTRYGICRHDYALTPCPKDKDCIRCGEHLFVKGNTQQITEAEDQIQLLTLGIRNAEKAISDGRYGAKRWLDLNSPKLERWKLALSLLTNPETPNGSLVSMPRPEVSQSKTGLADAIRTVANSNTRSDINQLNALEILK